MYENITFETILQRMLDRVSNEIDKREGSIIYNALAPAAAEFKQMLIEVDVILNETFADTASRENLIRRAAERGLRPDGATKAVFKGVFNINLEIGTRFTGADWVFKITEHLGGLNYRVECETPGSASNTALGAIVPVEYINGLTSAQLTELLVPGEDEEDTEVFRASYFNSFESQAFGGNRADYKKKVNGLPGVGGCKVKRTPSGGGTVGIVIIDSALGVPTPTLISDVQTAIDPLGNQGEGLGLAPIGHMVTVTGVTEATANFSTTITYAPEWDWPALKPYFDDMVDAYLLELKKAWQNETQLIVRISQVESRALNLAGVIDISGTTINGQAVNLVLGINEIPKRGTTNG